MNAAKWLTRLIGRMPIGWLQLTHSRGRMAAAIAGVAFANVLVFLQLGILGALNGTIEFSYNPVTADILVSSSDANTLTDGSPVHRRLLWKILAIPGVESASTLYIGKTDWRMPNDTISSLNVYALPPEAKEFVGPLLRGKFDAIALPGAVLIDNMTRGIDVQMAAALAEKQVMNIELMGMTVNIVDSFRLGGGFSADGALITSSQTFMSLFRMRSSGTPTHLLVNVQDGAKLPAVVAHIQRELSAEHVKVRSLAEAQADDLAYQTTQRPIGVIFGFGVFIGILVGLVIVYQVLSTDVADHLKEYATFKAMGYRHSFFLGIVIEEAVILAVLGFVPGVIFAFLIYYGMSNATGLPVSMDLTRASVVFVGTVISCTISGALATRRLKSANPAELF